MFDKEEAIKAVEAIANKPMGGVLSPANPQHWYSDDDLKNIHSEQTVILFTKKIESLITRIGYHPSTPTTCNHVTQLRKLMICVQEGQQPRKATLKILNRWWKLYEPKL